MLNLLRTIKSFIIGLFVKPLSNDQGNAYEKVVAEKLGITDTWLDGNPGGKQSHRLACFLHTRNRVQERYKLNINPDHYVQWIKDIKSGKAWFVQDVVGDAKQFIVKHFDSPIAKRILIVYKEDKVLTALPYSYDLENKARSMRIAKKIRAKAKHLNK